MTDRTPPAGAPRRGLGHAAEDYLKAIHAHTEWQSVPITTTSLAASLSLAPSTATEMVKKLAAAGLVTHVRYGAVSLTPEGSALALAMTRRHRLIETWLVESFGYTWDEVHDEADVLEHAVSDRLLDAIAQQLGDPVRDPHGDPIPTRSGEIVIPDAVSLGDLADGSSGVVVRIRDRDPELLRYLAAEGVSVDARVTVEQRRPFGGALVVRVTPAGGGPETVIDLGAEATASCWVAVDGRA
ncbi:metal-dependent transcriptional regulator [Marisediminicola sp. LYQ134]|uniref:metal-dependent transcriptional regulator n=1 Tax=unclassified Marisediminicola TaxID=2618316 RepID=UPI003983A9D7